MSKKLKQSNDRAIELMMKQLLVPSNSLSAIRIAKDVEDLKKKRKVK
jgi:hypothetical protein